MKIRALFRKNSMSYHDIAFEITLLKCTALFSLKNIFIRTDKQIRELKIFYIHAIHQRSHSNIKHHPNSLSFHIFPLLCPPTVNELW